MNGPSERTAEAMRLMTSFLDRTGVLGARTQTRYLWTDAFAVCNLVGLARTTGGPELLGLARILVDRVHHTLGHHRPDEARRGWLGSASEDHPTRGGLRIGKPLPERRPGEPADERREWDQDGQYFHYLTRWMQALDQLARALGEKRLNLWARELAAAAFAGFAIPGPAAPSRLAWKMSIDLSRPLVSSMGQHDALDGAVTCAQLRQTAASLADTAGGPTLREEERALRALAERTDWTTNDPLGMGVLLADAGWTAQLVADGFEDPLLLPRLLAAALPGLRALHAAGEPRGDASGRLAFRELGLAIGLGALPAVTRSLAAAPGRFEDATQIASLLRSLEEHVPRAEQIRSFWLEPRNQRASSWREHLDINAVMLATSLVPDGFLVLVLPPAPGSEP